MKTKKLKTGVEITTNEKNEIISVSSPYWNDEPIDKGNELQGVMTYLLIAFVLLSFTLLISFLITLAL